MPSLRVHHTLRRVILLNQALSLNSSPRRTELKQLDFAGFCDDDFSLEVTNQLGVVWKSKFQVLAPILTSSLCSSQLGAL